MSPVTVAGTLTQVLAEVLAGCVVHAADPSGAPVLFGTFASSISMQSGAPDLRHAGAVAGVLWRGTAGTRLGLPFRTGGSLCASKVPDAQAAYEAPTR